MFGYPFLCTASPAVYIVCHQPTWLCLPPRKSRLQPWFSRTPGLILHLSVRCTLCCLPRQRSKSHFHLLRPILMSLARNHVAAGFLHIVAIDILDKLVLYLEWGLVLFSFQFCFLICFLFKVFSYTLGLYPQTTEPNQIQFPNPKSPSSILQSPNWSPERSTVLVNLGRKSLNSAGDFRKITTSKAHFSIHRPDTRPHTLKLVLIENEVGGGFQRLRSVVLLFPAWFGFVVDVVCLFPERGSRMLSLVISILERKQVARDERLLDEFPPESHSGKANSRLTNSCLSHIFFYFFWQVQSNPWGMFKTSIVMPFQRLKDSGDPFMI